MINEYSDNSSTNNKMHMTVPGSGTGRESGLSEDIVNILATDPETWSPEMKAKTQYNKSAPEKQTPQSDAAASSSSWIRKICRKPQKALSWIQMTFSRNPR